MSNYEITIYYIPVPRVPSVPTLFPATAMNLCRISAKHTRAVLAGGPAVWVG